MSGNTTHGFDLVVEFSERFFNQFLGTALDTPSGSGGGSLLCRALEGMGAGFLCGAFTVDVSMDRPATTDVAIPAGESDILDIRITLAGGVATLRLVAGLMIDRSLPDADVIFIDFRDRLFAARISLPGIPIPDSLVRSSIASTFGRIPLPSVPLPGGRSSIDPLQIIRADTKIIDDRSAADRDAWALLLTFGGGSPGNLAQFTESFIPPGGNGAISIFFNWLCRIISPLVADALGIPRDAFTNCSLNRSIVINADENVTLTRLQLTLVDDFIQVSASVQKSGFCYTATGTITARLRMVVEGGRLIVRSEVDDPDIDVSIPWYCWLIAVAVGAVLAVIGGVLFGVIGAIVGAVIVPLIMWIASEIIEGVIENVTESIRSALDALEIEADIAIPGLEFILDDVFIDDITIRARVRVRDTTPVRHSGILFVPDNSTVDLDKGIVSGPGATGADIKWSGDGFARRLETVCISSLARTGSREFDTFSRYDLYGFSYLSPNTVPFNELAVIIPLGGIFGIDRFAALQYTYAVRTNENRYAIVRVLDVGDNYIRLQYKTFENVTMSLDITGGFRCEGGIFTPIDAVAEFTPSALIEQIRPVALSGGRVTEEPPPAAVTHIAERNLTTGLLRPAIGNQAAVKYVLPVSTVKESFYTELCQADRNIGHWAAEIASVRHEVGRFTAISTGLKAPVTWQWSVNSDALEGTTGTVTVNGKRMEYTIAANRLTLKMLDRVRFQFELKVTAIDSRSEVLVKTKCITYEPVCKIKKRHIPKFDVYQAAHMLLWGIVEETPVTKGVSPGPAITHR